MTKMNSNENNFNLLRTSYYESKKSKFYGFMYELKSESNFEQIFNYLRKDHKKARHICYAYIFNQQLKASDDHEPKGTASLSLINALKNHNQDNIAIFVVRYFGNIKLGLGGLFRAYSKTASMLFSNE